ncbi:MAG TPA: OmpA family protein [Polyangiaceae bacterium]|jgi:outer membrane protein OmpA-like peptidoglycan-associated protein
MTRVSAITILACAWLAIPIAHAESNAPPPGADSARSSLEVSVDLSKVDLKAHQLELKMNHEASKVTIKVIGESGSVLANEEQLEAGRPAGALIVVKWSPASEEPAARIELFAYDKDGVFKGVAITPWSLSIPHQEVNFRRDSSAIDDPEKPKLEASLVTITEAVKAHENLGAITLFIAGHTDTVGPASHNLTLSRSRARAIASWFAQHGLKLGIAFEGFGESALLIKTADEVDEPRNRRVDYILAMREPIMKTSGFHPAWKHIQ